jgi:hypothetical protein
MAHNLLHCLRFLLFSHFVVDYVTRAAYDSGTIQNCAWTFVSMLLTPASAEVLFFALRRAAQPLVLRRPIGKPIDGGISGFARS